MNNGMLLIGLMLAGLFLMRPQSPTGSANYGYKYTPGFGQDPASDVI